MQYKEWFLYELGKVSYHYENKLFLFYQIDRYFLSILIIDLPYNPTGVETAQSGFEAILQSFRPP